MRKFLTMSAAVALTAALAPAVQAQTNVVPAHWASIARPVGEGTLRPNSGWENGSTPSDVITLVDGVFAPEQQQWNNGSYWWDETQTVTPFQTVLTLDQSFTFDHLIVQADNNDDYLVEYWDGTDWQSVFTAGAVAGYGLMTRDSGLLSAFTTNSFRFTGLNGDQYYSISEFQAFTAGVPEASTWALMILGFGAVGGALRRRSAARVTFA